MEIYVKMDEKELEEFKKFKEQKEIETEFNDSNVIDYIIKRYKQIQGMNLNRYYNYLVNNHPISNRALEFDLKAENKKIHISSISVKTNEWTT